MSLTSELNDPGTSLSAFVAAQFPRIKEFGRLITWPVGEYLAMLGGRGPIGELRRACREALVG